jgi:fatty acid desaturase
VFLARAAIQNLPVLLTQAAILLMYAGILGPVYYLGLYVLPILTLYPAQIRLRSTVEHSLDVGVRGRSPDQIWVSRTTRGRWLERLVVAPLAINYHFEHHLFPAVPHYNLGRLHRLLVDAGFPVPIVSSYLGFVAAKRRTERSAIRVS